MIFTAALINLQLWLFWVWKILWKGKNTFNPWDWNNDDIKLLLSLFGSLYSWDGSEVGFNLNCFEYIWCDQPTELNTYYDIEAVLSCLKSEYEIKTEDMILYGQSVGSGPTLHLASCLQRLRAVVLHSAILSGIRVLFPVKTTLWFDIFKVIKLFCFPIHFISAAHQHLKARLNLSSLI